MSLLEAVYIQRIFTHARKKKKKGTKNEDLLIMLATYDTTELQVG